MYFSKNVFLSVYVFLLLSMYSYCCICILIVVYVFLDAATLTEVFCAFSSFVRQMPGYSQPRRGTSRTHTIVVLFYVLFVLYRSIYCLCGNVYCCHRVTTQLQLTNISYHIICQSLHVSGNYVPIIRRNDCVCGTLDTCYSVWMFVWYAGWNDQTVIHAE